MEAFTDFILQVTYSPNPIRALDNPLTDTQDAGRLPLGGVNCGIPVLPDRASVGDHSSLVEKRCVQRLRLSAILLDMHKIFIQSG